MRRFEIRQMRIAPDTSAPEIVATFDFLDVLTGLEYRQFRLIDRARTYIVTGPRPEHAGSYIVECAYNNPRGEDWFEDLTNEALARYRREMILKRGSGSALRHASSPALPANARGADASGDPDR